MKIKVDVELSVMHVRVIELVENTPLPINIYQIQQELMPCDSQGYGYITSIIKDLIFLGILRQRQTPQNNLYIESARRLEELVEDKE